MEENEISKYPGVELVLIDGLISLETHNGEMQKKWRVYHRFNVFETNTSGQHYSVDFSLAIVEISVSSSDISKEFKDLEAQGCGVQRALLRVVDVHETF